jgi:hypothetical protein
VEVAGLAAGGQGADAVLVAHRGGGLLVEDGRVVAGGRVPAAVRPAGVGVLVGQGGQPQPQVRAGLQQRLEPVGVPAPSWTATLASPTAVLVSCRAAATSP